MKQNRWISGWNFLAIVGCVAGLSACGPTLKAPFDTLKKPEVSITAYRLQNYEPPQAAAAATAAAGAGGLLSALPPEIQTWVQQGAQGLQQLLPPGLLPPGMLQQAAAAPPPNPGAPRFHGFRILGQTQVLNTEVKEDLGKLLGDEDSFSSESADCAYAEMGLSITGAPGAAPHDLLISFSCNRMISKSFNWPHPNSGMTPDTVRDLSGIVQKLWPSTGAPPAR